MKRWLWLLAPLPAAVGIGVRAYLFFNPGGSYLIYLKADLGSFALVLGLVLSALTAALLFFWSASERRRQQSLADSADERRRFLRRLDHELKNPLTAIRAGLANLADSPAEGSRQEALVSIENQTLRLGRLSTDLRKLADLEVRPLEGSPVDIPALLQEAFSMAQEQPVAGQRRLSLSIPSAPWPLPKISGDPDLLILAVYNLLENALKFTRPGDTIELRAAEDGSSIVIEVADTGPGIPDDEQPHVWEELYRGQAGRGVPGSGLGLALVRLIAERHHGRASLRSRLGQGTVFTLRLPLG